MSGTDSTAQPSDERQSNRTRRPQIRKTPRAPFPLITERREDSRVRGAAALRTADLDTSDPAAGGGRGFSYQWEETAAVLETKIDAVAAGGGVAPPPYVYTQSTPSAQWVIDHHLGVIPDVLVLDNSGQQLIAELRFPSDQTCVVTHSAPYAGTAYLRS